MSSLIAQDLRGKTIILTGGSGLLGGQYTQSLLEQGANIAIFDLAPPRISSPQTNSLMFVQTDITQQDSWKSALQQVVSKWGVPYGLINNAAIDSPPNAPLTENGPFETYPLESWNKVLNVNLTGMFLGCQIVGREMAKQKCGAIVNISSIYGHVSPDQNLYEYRRQNGEEFYKPIGYSVTKAGVLNLTRYLGVYWAKQGVRVNALTLSGAFNHQDEAFLKNYCARIPIGRMATPDEFTGAMIFLLSQASSYMTGSNLTIDGGWLAI